MQLILKIIFKNKKINENKNIYIINFNQIVKLKIIKLL